MENKTGLAKKILAVMREVESIDKDGTNKFQKYKYVSEANIVGKIRASMVSNGLIAIPNMVSCVDQPAGTTSGGTMQFLSTICVDYKLIDTDTGESETVRMFSQGIDSGDKGVFKAITGSNKYFLLKTFQIATDDDPENEQVPAQRTASTTSAPATTAMATDKQVKMIQDLYSNIDEELLSDTQHSFIGKFTSDESVRTKANASRIIDSLQAMKNKQTT